MGNVAICLWLCVLGRNYSIDVELVRDGVQAITNVGKKQYIMVESCFYFAAGESESVLLCYVNIMEVITSLLCFTLATKEFNNY